MAGLRGLNAMGTGRWADGPYVYFVSDATGCCIPASVVRVSHMMHLTFSDKSLLLGDQAAELVVEYAAALARGHSADTVKLTAYGADGDKVEATLLLDEGAPLMIETSSSDLPEPDNTPAIEHILARLAQLSATVQAVPIEEIDDRTMADFEHDFGPGETPAN